MTTDENEAKAVERAALDNLYSHLDTFKRFERPLAMMLRRKYTPEEVMEAEGKRCVINVTGLRFHNVTLFFQVSGLAVKQVEPYEGYDTFIQAPLKTVINFFKRVLSGDTDTFGDLVGGNDVKIRGPRTYHDILVFEDACRTLAMNIQRLRG